MSADTDQFNTGHKIYCAGAKIYARDRLDEPRIPVFDAGMADTPPDPIDDSMAVAAAVQLIGLDLPPETVVGVVQNLAALRDHAAKLE